jgi:hypothetical protein
MNQAPSPISQQVGIIVVMLVTAVIAGVLIGWLLSPDLPVQVAQSPQPIDTLPPLNETGVAAAPPTITAASSSPTIAPTGIPTTAPTNAPTIAPTGVVTTAPTIAPTGIPTAAPTNAPTIAPTGVATAAPTTAPTGTSTAAPTNAPTIAPTGVATTAPTIAPTQEPAITLVQQIAAAEAALRSGELEAVLDYGGGTKSSAQVRFDFGSAEQPQRLDFRTTYQGSDSTQTLQQITIGDRCWERRDTQGWTPAAPKNDIGDQIRFFLPQSRSAERPRYVQQADRAELRWYDAGHDADVTLLFDPDTNMPRSLQRQPRRTGVVLSVTYKRWNTPVEILPPVTTLR